MPYLVRKVMNRKHIEEDIRETKDADKIGADIVTSEFRTKGNTLSTWKSNEPGGKSLDEAILAIAITSTKLERMDFIIIDTDLIVVNNLEYKPSDPGVPMPIEELKDLHNDIVNITLCKLNNMTQLYKMVDNTNQELIIRYPKPRIVKLVEDAIKNKRVKIENVNKDLRDELIKINTKINGQAS